MVYKRYIVQNGKRYGPYYYESKRIGGKVIGRYVKKSRFALERVRTPFILVLSGIVLTLLIFYFILSFSPTGRATLSLNDVRAGEALTGTVTLSLQPGELIPTDTQVSATLGPQEHVSSLSELVSIPPVSGVYYASGTSLLGSGAGYGAAGTMTISPNVSFTLRISSDVGGGGEQGSSGSSGSGLDLRRRIQRSVCGGCTRSLNSECRSRLHRE